MKRSDAVNRVVRIVFESTDGNYTMGDSEASKLLELIETELEMKPPTAYTDDQSKADLELGVSFASKRGRYIICQGTWEPES